MLLEILHNDGKIEKIEIKRASNISSKTTIQYLYYEKLGDMVGQGTKIEMSKILCWEIT